MAEFELQGVDQVLAKLRAAAPEMRNKAMRTALRKGANVVRDAAKEGAERVDDPATPERIADNVAISFDGKHLKRTGDLKFRVGVRGGAKQYADTKRNRRAGRVGKSYATGGDTWYWRLVEFGTVKTAARPFMRPALAANVDRATDAVVDELNKALDRQFKKR